MKGGGIDGNPNALIVILSVSDDQETKNVI